MATIKNSSPSYKAKNNVNTKQIKIKHRQQKHTNITHKNISIYKVVTALKQKQM